MTSSHPSHSAAVDSKAKQIVFGLILAGGKSTRMETDKSSLRFEGVTLRDRAFQALLPHVDHVYLSLREEPFEALIPVSTSSQIGRNDVLLDQLKDVGPVAALIAAHTFMPQVAWLVLASDFPFASSAGVADLLRHHASDAPLNFEKTYPSLITCFEHADGTPEPLFAVWTSEALARLQKNFEKGISGPIQTLKRVHPRTVVPQNPEWIINVNTKADWEVYRDPNRKMRSGSDPSN